MAAERAGKEARKVPIRQNIRLEDEPQNLETPASANLDPASVLKLQGLVGNRTVQRLLARNNSLNGIAAQRPPRSSRLPGAAQRKFPEKPEEENEEGAEDREVEAPEFAGSPPSVPGRSVSALPSAINAEIYEPGLPAIQRESAAPAVKSADQLIDDRTNWLGMLDEEGLGSDLAALLPAQSGLVEQVLNKLADSDRDDVAYEITRALQGQLGKISEALRIRFVREMVYGMVTDEEEGMIAALWISFEPRLVDVAERNRELWKRSLWESDQLVDHIRHIVAAFAQDVRSLARTYLAENKQALIAEGKRYGIDLEGQQNITPTQLNYMQAVRAVVPGVVKLRKQLDELKQIKVGYNTQYDPETGMAVGDVAARFNLENKPEKPPTGTETPPWPTWDEVKTQHDRVTAVISAFADLYPTIYLLIQQDKLEALDQAVDSSKAQQVVLETLQKTDKKIQEADEKIVSGKISHYDLKLIQSQLLSGSAKTAYEPKHPWEKPFYQDIVNDDIKGHEAREFWTDLGLSVVAAAALIAAPFTGGATAAFLVGFGIGIGVGQAGMSWDKYLQLSALGDANVKEEIALVAEGQVSAELVNAIVQTVAVFLDVYGAKAATAGARLGREAVEAAEKGLKQQVAEEARKRMIREAAKDAGITAGGAGLAIGMHELGDDEPVPDFEGSVTHHQVNLGPETPEAPSTSLNRMVIQRAGGGGPATAPSKQALVLTGGEFEAYIEKALLKGPLGDLPKMDFVIPGQYTGSGWGIDRIGIVFDEATGMIDVYHLEMKYVAEGSSHIPELGTSRAGTQTGGAWTQRAVDNFLNSQHPTARAGKERLRRALQKMHPGETIDIERMRAFLHEKLVNAKIRVIVPPWADLRRLYKQVAALVRWGREARILTHIPK